MKDWFPQALIHYIIDYGKYWIHGHWIVFGVLRGKFFIHIFELSIITHHHLIHYIIDYGKYLIHGHWKVFGVLRGNFSYDILS